MNEITAGMNKIMDCITKNQETSKSLLELIKESNRKLLELAAQVDVLTEEVVKLKQEKGK